MPYLGLAPTELATLSDREITAQHTVLHTHCICRVCLLVYRIEALYAKSQGSAHFCALCCTVLMLTPKLMEVLTHTIDRRRAESCS